MDIKDLSIGDWVQDKNGTYAQILGIENWSDCYVLNVRINGVDVGCVPASSALPIPITPEILEKNGFIDYEVGKGWYILNVADDLRVWLHRNSHDWTFQIMKWSPLSTHEIGKVFIKHIHQLQHALRLAGVDKEITL